MRYLSFLLTMVCLIGCTAPRYSDFFLYRDDGSCKPKVAFLPITGCDSLENAIIFQARESGELFFYTQEEVQAVLSKNSLSPAEDLSTVSKYFCPADFVVEAELIDDLILNAERLEIPVIRRNPQEHLVRLRLQVMDIRSGKPKMVLFEVLEERELVITRENCTIAKPSIYTLLAEKAASRIEERICQTLFR